MFDSLKPLVLLGMMFVLPISFIIYGIIRKRDKNSSYVFLLGSFFLSCDIAFLISPLIGNGICSCLTILGITAEMKDTSKLALLLSFPITFVFYKAYTVILYWESRSYVSSVKELVAIWQSDEWPDCTKIVLKEFRERILHQKKQKVRRSDQAFVEKQLYFTLKKMLSSDSYRMLYGGFTSEGEQLKHILESCIFSLFEKGVISGQDKDNLLNLQNYNYSEPEIIRSMMK